MKILVCTDGSEQSQKALEKASLLIEGCKNVDEIALIHVYDQKHDMPIASEGITAKQMGRMKSMSEEYQEERKRFLTDALKIFKSKKAKMRMILEEGEPAETIIKVAEEEGFNLIVLGSRGLGGLKKLILGSVSNKVVQQAKNCSVLTVK